MRCLKQSKVCRPILGLSLMLLDLRDSFLDMRVDRLTYLPVRRAPVFVAARLWKIVLSPVIRPTSDSLFSVACGDF